MIEETQAEDRTLTEAAIQAWLVARIEAALDLAPGKVDIHKPLSRFGLDSMIAVGLSADLEDWLGRTLAPTILAEHPTIEALARHLARAVPPAEAETPDRSDPSGIHTAGSATNAYPAPTRWSPLQARIRTILSFLVRRLCRLDTAGSGKFPSSGAFLLAINHLHVLDTPLLFSFMARPAVFFVSSHMKRFPIARWFLSGVANTIWVSRGEGDIQAIQSALAALRAGGVVVVAPEGMISRSGGLLKGRTGVAYLAAQADVPVLPVVAWGQEKAFQHWLRLRRAPISFRIGDLVHLSSGKATARQLEDNTDAIMIALARLLPQKYRGVYGDAVTPGGR